MNAKLGLFLGMNVAVACMVMQGCKANRPETGAPLPPDNTITVMPGPADTPPPAVAQPPAPPSSSAAMAPSGATITVEPVEPAKTQIRSVKPISSRPSAARPAAVTAKTEAPAAAKADPSETAVYVVKPGDSLSKISKSYNIRMSAIVDANPGLNPDRIRIGQRIAIPGSASVAAKAPAAGAPVVMMKASAPAPAAAANVKAPIKTKSAYKAYEGPTKDYTVKSGDSLGKIAVESGISIRALKALNGLQKDNVRVGQKLKIPAEKVVAATAAKPAATARPDEKNAAAPVDEKNAVVPAADAKGGAAPVVDTASVTKPVDTSVPAAVEPSDPVPAAPAADGPTHTVKDGEDLVSIAIQYSISPSTLMDLNDIKAGEVVPAGRVLKLPASAKASVQ